MLPSRRCALGRGALLGAIAVACASFAPSGARGDEAADRSERPLATAAPLAEGPEVERLTWTASGDVTRIRFHGSLPAPVLSRPRPDVLRVDLTGARGGGPAVLGISSRQVVSVTRVPDQALALLPSGVSARWLITLTSGDLATAVRTDAHGFTIFAGAEGAAPPPEVTTPVASAYAAPASPAITEVGPDPADMRDKAMPFAVTATQPLRAAPSDLASEMGSVTAGETRIADAVHEGWMHLTSGGWLRLTPVGSVPPLIAAPAGLRSPMAWSVMTLGTGLDVQVQEIQPGADPAADELRGLFTAPLSMARLRVRVPDTTQYQFKLPAKKGRLQFLMKDGGTIESLGAEDLRLRDPADRERLDAAIQAPPLVPGTSWETVLLLPEKLDFAKVKEARLDVGGQLHRLFLVPGSGEAPEPMAPLLGGASPKDAPPARP